MITAVDTNVLVDVLRGDPVCGAASEAAILRASELGPIVACDVVWAELAALYEDRVSFRVAVAELPVLYLPCSDLAAERAGRMWRLVRSRGGGRTRALADFLVGAHAMVQCDRLLTRDRGFYRDYFEGLAIVDPAS